MLTARKPDQEPSATVPIAAHQAVADPQPPGNRLTRAWRWLRLTGCLAGAGLLLALATVAAGAQQQQQPQPQPQLRCFTVVGTNNPSALQNIGAILLDRCTGKTWQLRLGEDSVMRWYPIPVGPPPG
jgi:hypothetical protein